MVSYFVNIFKCLVPENQQQYLSLSGLIIFCQFLWHYIKDLQTIIQTQKLRNSTVKKQMQKQSHRINYKNYCFELHFKTEYCLSIIATNTFEGKRYENKNIEFKKLQSSSILNSLEEKNPNQIKCKITEAVAHADDEDLKVFQGKAKKEKQTCLKLQFAVTLAYILPFSQEAILYEVDSYKRTENLVPKKITKKVAKQLQLEIDEVEKALPSQINNYELQVFQINAQNLAKTTYQTERQTIFIIGSNIALLIVFIVYISFLEYIGCLAILLGSIYLYYCKQKFLIKEFNVKQGHYKLQVTGIMTVQNYSQQATDSFCLYAGFNQWDYQMVKISTMNNYSYGYPFNAAFIIESPKEQDVYVKIQKNTKIYPTSISNVIITLQKIPSPFLLKN